MTWSWSKPVDAERRDGTLRLTVLRFGQSRPTRLEMCRGRDRRTATAQRAARTAYERQLRRVLERAFPGYDVNRLTSAPDLERSFGPVYARGCSSAGSQPGQSWE